MPVEQNTGTTKPNQAYRGAWRLVDTTLDRTYVAVTGGIYGRLGCKYVGKSRGSRGVHDYFTLQ